MRWKSPSARPQRPRTGLKAGPLCRRDPCRRGDRRCSRAARRAWSLGGPIPCASKLVRQDRGASRGVMPRRSTTSSTTHHSFAIRRQRLNSRRADARRCATQARSTLTPAPFPAGRHEAYRPSIRIRASTNASWRRRVSRRPHLEAEASSTARMRLSRSTKCGRAARSVLCLGPASGSGGRSQPEVVALVDARRIASGHGQLLRAGEGVDDRHELRQPAQQMVCRPELCGFAGHVLLPWKVGVRQVERAARLRVAA